MRPRALDNPGDCRMQETPQPRQPKRLQATSIARGGETWHDVSPARVVSELVWLVSEACLSRVETKWPLSARRELPSSDICLAPQEGGSNAGVCVGVWKNQAAGKNEKNSRCDAVIKWGQASALFSSHHPCTEAGMLIPGTRTRRSCDGRGFASARLQPRLSPASEPFVVGAGCP